MPLVGADYGQMELRVSTLAWPDPKWTAAIGSDTDMHEQVARTVLGITADKVPEEDRVLAKNCNFGVLYGSKGAQIVEQTGRPLEVVRAFIDGMYSTFPGFFGQIEVDKKQIHASGEFTTIMGWKQEVNVYDKPRRDREKKVWEYSRRDAEELRYAINAKVQGPAAQITLAAHILLHRWLSGRTDAMMVNNVHDAIYIDCKQNVVDEIMEGMRHLMINIPLGDIFGFELPVPLKVDVAVGDSWGDMH